MKVAQTIAALQIAFEVFRHVEDKKLLKILVCAVIDQPKDVERRLTLIRLLKDTVDKMLDSGRSKHEGS